MVVLKKTVLEDGTEWLDPTVIFDEFDPKTEKPFLIAKCVSDVLLYFVENTPDAFGNAPYARLVGFMQGYISGIGATIDDKGEYWDVRKGKRVIVRVEVPKKPKAYFDALKDNREMISVEESFHCKKGEV